MHGHLLCVGVEPHDARFAFAEQLEKNAEIDRSAWPSSRFFCEAAVCPECFHFRSLENDLIVIICHQYLTLSNGQQGDYQ